MPHVMMFLFPMLLCFGCSAESFFAGFGKADITPPFLMWMSGYAARSKPAEGTFSKLWTKAMVMGHNGKIEAVVITFDLVGLDGGTSAELVSTVQAEIPAIKRDGILLNCSHTHCGPVVRNNLIVMYELDSMQKGLIDRYAEFLKKQVRQAVVQAAKDFAPATLRHGVGNTDFAVNRRNNPEPNVFKLRTEGRLKGPRDHRVPVLGVFGSDGTWRGVVFSYACHATTLDFYQWCGDYPGFAQTELETQFPGVMSMFLAGCGGDQNPLPRRKPELAQQYGKKLAMAVSKVMTSSMSPVAVSLKTNFQTIPLPFSHVPSRDEWAKRKNSGNRFEKARAHWLASDHNSDIDWQKGYPYPIQLWRFGDQVSWLGLGGEVVVDYALRVQRDLGPSVWTLGYCNDVMAYIPSERILNEGGYEGGGAMVYYGLPSPWKTGVEEVIFKHVYTQWEHLGRRVQDNRRQFQP
jgi:hypothetical protein